MTVILGVLLDLAASLGAGTALGLSCALLFRKFPALQKEPARQVCLCFLFGYLSYIVLQVLHFNGVVGALSCSLVLGQFAVQQQSLPGRLASSSAFRTLSHALSMAVHLYLAASLCPLITKITDWPFIALIIPLTLVARLASTVSLGVLAKLYQGSRATPLGGLWALWLSGCSWNLVPFALVLSLTPQSKEKETAWDQVKAAAIVVILAGSVFAKLIEPVLARLAPWAEREEDGRLTLLEMLNEQYIQGWLFGGQRQRRQGLGAQTWASCRNQSQLREQHEKCREHSEQSVRSEKWKG